jgi:hypothetical protein
VKSKAGKNTTHKYYTTWDMHMSSRFIAAAFGGLFLNFAQVSADFVGTVVVLHFSTKK